MTKNPSVNVFIKPGLIPILENNATFERVKAPRFDDRKWDCIDFSNLIEGNFPL
jgi:hypothetical protein